MIPKNRALTPIAAKNDVLELASAHAKDLSGHDFIGQSIEGQNFFESIFNGCNFERISASHSVFQHAEFTEARFVDCTFEGTSFDHSDFVMGVLDRCKFSHCSFQNAEWRDTVFNDVSFEQCVFRNTTISLAKLNNCIFDKSSSANFVGNSKRFCVFSGGQFLLSLKEIEFLRTNFGIVAADGVSLPPTQVDDPLFQISFNHYSGRLTPQIFCTLILHALAIMRDHKQPQRLRLQYIGHICEILLAETFLSIFGTELLEKCFSQTAQTIPDKTYALHLFNVILVLRVALRDQIVQVQQDLAEIPGIIAPRMTLNMEFERTFEAAAIDEYLGQMAEYCELRRDALHIERLVQGSTLVELVIQASVSLKKVYEFLRYSLSMAKITIQATDKLRKDCVALAKETNAGQLPLKVSSRRRQRSRPRKEMTAEATTAEIVGNRSADLMPIEVFVHKTGDRVLVLDGKVRITISVN